MELNIKQSQNILNWYKFNQDDEILEIGGNLGELTSRFCQNVKSVTTIEPNSINAEEISKKCENYNNLEIIKNNFKNIELEKQYDKIILIGITSRIKEIFGENISLEQIIKKLEKNLKQNGKFIIAIDNKFGLRYFAGNPENVLNKKFISLIGYNNEQEKIETFTKKKLENILKKLGYNYNFYYPLPDYKMPDVIFSDKQLPQYNSVDKYNPYYTEKSTIIINEIDVFREILKDNPEMFEFFTNSFLIEISKENLDYKYNYISFNNLRKEEYRLITKIADEYVEKEPVNEKAHEHYEKIKQNIEILKNLDIKTLDYIENDIIKSKYINQELLLNNILTKKLEENKYNEFEEILNKYIKILNTKTYKENDYDKTVFGKYNIQIDNKEIINELNFMENGLWDMTFKNCFYINNDLFFFDQEWNEKNMPSEYILYRSILYTISLRRYINIEELFEKYDIKKYLDLFKKLDDKLQEKIRDDKIWKTYNKDYFIDIDKTKQELVNLNLRSEAKDKAIENMQKEIESLKIENQKIINQNIQLENNTLSNRIKKRLKKLTNKT